MQSQCTHTACTARQNGVTSTHSHSPHSARIPRTNSARKQRAQRVRISCPTRALAAHNQQVCTVQRSVAYMPEHEQHEEWTFHFHQPTERSPRDRHSRSRSQMAGESWHAHGAGQSEKRARHSSRAPSMQKEPEAKPTAPSCEWIKKVTICNNNTSIENWLP